MHWYRYVHAQTCKAAVEFNYRAQFSLSHLSFFLSGWNCRGFSSVRTPSLDRRCLPPGGFGSPCLSQRQWESRAAAPKSPGCAFAACLCHCPVHSQTPLDKQVRLGFEHLWKYKGVFWGYSTRNPWHTWFIFVFETKDHVSCTSSGLFRSIMCASLIPL